MDSADAGMASGLPGVAILNAQFGVQTPRVPYRDAGRATAAVLEGGLFFLPASKGAQAGSIVSKVGSIGGKAARGAEVQLVNAAEDVGRRFVNGGTEAAAPSMRQPTAGRGTQDAAKDGGLIYRAASGTPTSMTPRAKDANGLSAANSLENALPGKNQIIDTSRLNNLCAVCDNLRTGHVSINPKDMSQMQGWINSRGSRDVHPLTKELMGAVVGTVNK